MCSYKEERENFGNADQKHTGLTYKHIIYNDEETSFRSTYGIWLPDSEETSCKSQLDIILKKITNSKDGDNSNSLVGDIDLCLICLDLSEPHDALEQLNHWVGLLNNHIQWNCVTDSLEILAQSVKNKWNNLDFTSNDPDMVSELNYVLSKNIGIPIVVVATKTDRFDDLESENFKDETFNYIQYKLRMECLALGAGLCYTSSKSGQNNDTLYHEILYHIGFKLKPSQPSVIDRSSINIPLGWDSLKKINLLKESLLTINETTDWKSAVPQTYRKYGNSNNSSSHSLN